MKQMLMDIESNNMEAKQVGQGSMGELAGLIKARFPVKEVKLTLDDTHFEIDFQDSVTDKAAQVKAIYGLVKEYVELYGDEEEEYQFKFRKGRELIDILHFNAPEAAYHIRMEIFGKEQDLRVQDVLGATGDYTIFNSDFESLGQISAVGVPPSDEELADAAEDPEAFYSDHVYADFSNLRIWKAFPDSLELYLPELLEKISAEIDKNYTPERINIDDPEDLSFWAEQFEISVEDLRKAVLASSDSIDDITAYLQK